MSDPVSFATLEEALAAAFGSIRPAAPPPFYCDSYSAEGVLLGCVPFWSVDRGAAARWAASVGGARWMIVCQKNGWEVASGACR